MNNKLIPIVLTLVVGIILAGSMLVPVISDAQTSLTKTDNVNAAETYNHTMDLISDNVTITIDYTNGGSEIAVAIGDTVKELDVSTTTTPRSLLFYSDVCILFVDRVADANSPVYCIESTGYVGNLSRATSVFTYDYSTKEASLTVNDELTFTDEVEKFAYVYTAESGKFGFFDVNKNPTVNKDASIEVLSMGGWWAKTIASCSATGTQWYNSGTTAIEGLVIAPANPVSEYAANISGNWTDNGNGTYTRTNSSLTVLYNDGEEDQSITQTSVVIAPISYVSYETNASSTLIGVIPILVIVALVMGAIGMVVVGRND